MALIADMPTLVAEVVTHPFWLFQWDLIWSTEFFTCSIVLFLSAILCSAAGIGGGGIYVAVLMVMGKLTPHDAVPLSKAVVFFGSISSLMVNLFFSIRWSGSSSGGKSVIDTDACRLVVPATLIGTFLGVLLNRHTSDSIIVILLTALLGLMTGMVARQARQQAIAEYEADTIPPLPIDGGSASSSSAAGTQGEGAGMTDDQADERQPLLPQQVQQQPVQQPRSSFMAVPAARKKFFVGSDCLLGGSLLFVVIVGGILRFHMHACRAEVLGDAAKLGACKHPVNAIFRGHMETWMKDASTVTILNQLAWSMPIWSCIAITMNFGFVANREVGWRPGTILTYQTVSILTGLLAGLVGVGGGLILSPFFLLTGMEPAIAVGTSATCVLFTSSSTTMQYVFTDRIIMSLALAYGIVTLVASFVGTYGVHYIQDRYARKSYITTIVALGVALSAMLSAIKFVYLVVDPQSADEEAKALLLEG